MPRNTVTMPPEKLARYAEWYVLRYAPSKARLLSKLKERSADPSFVFEIFEKLAPFINDQAGIRSAVELRLTYGKTLRNLAFKLRLKGFSQEDIDIVFSEFEEAVTDWESRSKTVLLKMRKCANSWKSKTEALFVLLRDFPEFRDRVEELVRREYPDDVVTLWVLRNVRPSIFWGNEKTLSERLVRKGFSYDSVKKFLNRKGSDLEY